MAGMASQKEEVIESLLRIGFQHTGQEVFTEDSVNLRRGDVLVSVRERKMHIMRCLQDGTRLGRTHTLPLTDPGMLMDTIAIFDRREN